MLDPAPVVAVALESRESYVIDVNCQALGCRAVAVAPGGAWIPMEGMAFDE